MSLGIECKVESIAFTQQLAASAVGGKPQGVDALPLDPEFYSGQTRRQNGLKTQLGIDAILRSHGVWP